MANQLSSRHPKYEEYDVLRREMNAAERRGDTALADQIRVSVSELAEQIGSDLNLPNANRPIDPQAKKELHHTTAVERPAAKPGKPGGEFIQ